MFCLQDTSAPEVQITSQQQTTVKSWVHLQYNIGT